MVLPADDLAECNLRYEITLLLPISNDQEKKMKMDDALKKVGKNNMVRYGTCKDHLSIH